jgi:hypothetical protein
MFGLGGLMPSARPEDWEALATSRDQILYFNVSKPLRMI